MTNAEEILKEHVTLDIECIDRMYLSRTQVFDDPVRGRQWFEAIIRDNLDVGRTDRTRLVFERRVTKRTPGYFRTKVVHEGVNPSLHAYYTRSCSDIRGSEIGNISKTQRGLATTTIEYNQKKPMCQLAHSFI